MVCGWLLASAWAGAGWTIAPLAPSTGVRLGAEHRVQLDVLAGPTLNLSDTRRVDDGFGVSFRVEGLVVGAHAELRVRGLVNDGPVQAGWAGSLGGALTRGSVRPVTERAAPPGTTWLRDLVVWTGPSISVALAESWRIGAEADLVRVTWQHASGASVPLGVPFEATVQSTTWRVQVDPVPRLWVTFAR